MTTAAGHLLLVGRGVMGSALAEAFPKRASSWSHAGFRELMDGSVACKGPPIDVVIDTTRDVAASTALSATLVEQLARGALYFSLSTVTPEHACTWAAGLQSRGVVPVVCPVTGSHWRARDARLSAFLWAPEGERARAAAAARALFAQEVYDFDTPADAMAFKLAFNECNAAILSACAGFHARLRNSGLLDKGMDVALREASWIQAAMKFSSDRLDDPACPVTITVRNMLKDLKYARTSFGENALAKAVESMFEAAFARDPERDFTAIFDG